MNFLLLALLTFSLGIGSIEENLQLKKVKGFDVIYIPQYDLVSEPGYPQLPRKTVLYFTGSYVPDSLKITKIKLKEIEGSFNIFPAQPPAILPIPGITAEAPPFVNPKEEIYKRERFPNEPVKLAKVGNLFGFGVVEVEFYPLIYGPKERKLYAVEEVEFQFVEGEHQMHSPPKYSEIAREVVEDLLKKVVANPSDVKVEVVKSESAGFDYVIITSSSLAPYFEPLVEWKRMKGLKATIRTTEWINSNYPGRDLQEKIRNYIKVAHADSGVLFVLLGGDDDVVPSRIAYAMCSEGGYFPDEDSLHADLYYSDLDGTWDADQDGQFGEVADSVDLFPDVIVGRAPVNTPEEVQTFVNKVITYEMDPPTDYLNHLLFFAEILWSDPYTDSGVAKDMIDSLFIPDSLLITKLYESLGNESPSSVISAINQGKNLLNHNGHGFYYVMGAGTGYLFNDDMDNLQNGDKLGILYSIGCWVGAFDYDAISEHYITNPNGGGVAFIGNSRYGWGSPGNPGYGYSDRFDLTFYELIFDEGIIHLGSALALDKALYIPYSLEENVYRWHQYQLNLLGDPEMVVWRGEPGVLCVTHPDTLPQGNAVVEVNVRDSHYNPVEGATVTITGDSIFVVGFTDISGFVSLNLDTQNAYSPVLTVTFPGSRPYMDTLHIEFEGGYPALIGSSIDDGAGNNDGFLNPGEEAYLTLVLENAGTEPVEGLSVILSSESDSIVVLDSTAQVPSLPAGSTVTLADEFLLGASPDIDTTTPVQLNILLNYSQGTRTVVLPLLIATPYLKLESIAVVSGDDSIPEPGESGILTLGIKNTGLGLAESVEVYFNVESIYLNLPADTFHLGDVKRDSTHSLSVNFSISPLTPVPLAEEIHVYMKTAGGQIFEQSFSFMIGLTGFSDDFEDGGDDWTSGGNWHVTDHRAYSGNHSFYCGIEGSWHYPNNARDTLISPPILAGIDPELSFYYFFDVATYGVDGMYVYVYKDGDTLLLDFIGSGGALDSSFNIGNSWVRNEYPLEFLNPGDTFRVAFIFTSDGEDWGEGFYIDDVSVTSLYQEVRSGYGIPHPEKRKISLAPNPLRDVMNIQYWSNQEGVLELEIYDVAGRRRETFKYRARKGRNLLNLRMKNSLASGIYFVIFKFNGERVDKRKVLIVR